MQKDVQVTEFRKQLEHEKMIGLLNDIVARYDYNVLCLMDECAKTCQIRIPKWTKLPACDNCKAKHESTRLHINSAEKTYDFKNIKKHLILNL